MANDWAAVMMNLASGIKIYVYAPVADTRKGIDGLSGIVRDEFQSDPTLLYPKILPEFGLCQDMGISERQYKAERIRLCGRPPSRRA